MDRPERGLRIVVSNDPSTLKASRILKEHALVNAFIEADETTIDSAFWALVDYLEPSLRLVSTPKEGATHERD